jgi:hypothetical protein
MIIRTVTPPARALDLVRASLAHLVTSVTPSPLMVNRIDKLCVGVPQLAYDAFLRDVAEGHGLDRARLTAYRYLVFTSGQAVAAVEVAVGRGGAVTEVTGINVGPFVAATVTAIQTAEKLDGADQTSYELRLLRISAMSVMALWLHAEQGERDLLIPLSPAPDDLTAGQVYPPAAFFALLRARAAARVALGDAP